MVCARFARVCHRSCHPEDRKECHLEDRKECHPEERSDEGSGPLRVETASDEAVPNRNDLDPSLRSG